ncbi:hypothetical protein PoB_005950100 [Plakobranchus ocellatus]|uniref:Uncharacterized protein n=1 Tax=Plakobranchus ocellatus TaxID=259542 RepID=A0AAV4CCE5_9GAST|nr:hypothetical protein PoB_005950100 [Plakobranchus ocellatus]
MFQQAHKAVVVELRKMISMRAFASAIKSQLRTKPAGLPKDGGRSAPPAPPKGKKAQKDSPAPIPQGAAEIKIPAKRRAKKSKSQEALGKHSIVLRLWPWMLRIRYPQSGGIPQPPAPQGPPPPLWSALPPPPNPNPPPPAEKPQGPSPFPSPPYPFTPKVHVQEGVKQPKKIKAWQASQRVACQEINSLW